MRRLLGVLVGAAMLIACAQDRSTPAAPTPPAPTTPTPQSCWYAVTPVEVSIPRESWTAEVSIDAPPGCAWTAKSTAPWLTVRTTSGAGSATLTYEAEFNPQVEYSSRRTGAIEIRWPTATEGQNVRVVQWGDCRIVASPATDGLPAGAVYAGSPALVSGTLTMSAAGGRVHFWVLSDPFIGCAWSAESDDSWVQWSSPRLHQIMAGDGDLVFTVPAKTTIETRRAVVTLGGRYRLTIVQ